MEDNSEYKNGFPKIDVNKDSVLKMLTKVAMFKMEERDLALDRFKRANEAMGEDNDFWLQGKTAIAYLDSACKSSNYLGDMAKDVMKLVFKEDPAPNNNVMSDNDRKELSMIAMSLVNERRKKTLPPSSEQSDTD